MSDVTVYATRDFPYRGQPVRRGQQVAMAPIDAAIRARQGFVTLTVGDIPRPKPEPVQVRARSRRNTYKRRDMTAEKTT